MAAVGDMQPDETQHEHGSRPVPDPTVLTTQAVDRAMRDENRWVESQIDILAQRLDGMDKANDLRLRRLDHVPDQIDSAVSHLRDVVEQKFINVGNGFVALQERMAEQKKDTKDAVDAAFLAAKDAVNLQTEASEKSIAKSEAGTTKQIDSLGVQATTAIDALKEQINDLKLEVSRINATKSGGTEEHAASRDRTADNRAYVALAITVILFAVTIIGFVIALANKP